MRHRPRFPRRVRVRFDPYWMGGVWVATGAWRGIVQGTTVGRTPLAAVSDLAADYRWKNHAKFEALGDHGQWLPWKLTA